VTETLFTAADVWNGDPLNPDTETVTPAEIVAKLSSGQRRRRVINLEDQARRIYTDALTTHLGGRKLVASCVLFSGGNDSTTLAHMFRDTATHAIHANTTIGIEQTRQFVRDTCASWGLPLIEKRAPVSYRDLVLERGFPGPAMHWKMYSRLKERALDLARHDLGVANSRTKAAVFIAGRRRAESERRQDVPLYESDGSVIWVSPLAMWTKLDLNTYREMHPDVPRNEVSDLLHMSGECLCGAFAKPSELDAIGEWFPEVRAEIEELQRDVSAAGHAPPFCRWGHGEGAPSPSGRLCSSCAVPGQLDLLDGDAA
jgi:3'-phosphoadenosine 5'-phosphosulfate sulfotransferase (PAPS reductase)/FAD synthetase